MPTFLEKILLNLELKKLQTMNSTQLINLLVSLLTGITATMAAKWGIDPATWQNDLTEWVTAAVTAALLIGNHFFHGDPPSGNSGGTIGKASPMLLALIAGGLMTILPGCSITKVAQNGDIISVTSRGLGVNIMLTGASSELPQVQAGIFAQNVQLIPSSTNRLYSPDFASTANADSGYDPFTIAGNETTAAGLSSVYGASTTNVLVQPQTPMLWPTNSLK